MPIIGQRILLNTLSTQSLPQFSILWGESGSGKCTVAQYLSEVNNYIFKRVETKVDDIRQLIADTVGLSSKTLYYIKGDTLTIQAQNALLKLAEEPPRNAYIIVGVCNIDNLLPTIRSRAKTFMMDNYTYKELEQAYDAFNLVDIPKDKLCNISATPGQLLRYNELDFNGLLSYAEKVYDNILKVSTGNAFKICNKIDFKGDKGYPVIEFLQVFTQVILEHELTVVSSKMIEFTAQALRDMQIRGANKALIFDIWVLNIRSLR